MLASHAAGRRDATRGAGIPAGTGRIKHGLSSDNGGKKERDFLIMEPIFNNSHIATKVVKPALQITK